MIIVTSYVCTIQDNSDILIWYTPPFLNKYTYQIVPTLPQNKNQILIMYMTELYDEKQKQIGHVNEFYSPCGVLSLYYFQSVPSSLPWNLTFRFSWKQNHNYSDQ